MIREDGQVAGEDYEVNITLNRGDNETIKEESGVIREDGKLVREDGEVLLWVGIWWKLDWFMDC